MVIWDIRRGCWLTCPDGRTGQVLDVALKDGALHIQLGNAAEATLPEPLVLPVKEPLVGYSLEPARDGICGDTLTWYIVTVEREGESSATKHHIVAEDKEQACDMVTAQVGATAHDYVVAKRALPDAHIPLVIDQYTPAEGPCRTLQALRGRRISAVCADLVDALGDMVDEYFSCGSGEGYGQRSGARFPTRWAWLEWSAVRGGSEGHYVHGRLVERSEATYSPSPSRLLFIGKTFLGWERAYAIARRCAELTEE